MSDELGEKEIKLLREYGMYSCSAIASILSDLYSHDEIFGDWKISDLISALQKEESKLWRKQHLGDEYV